MNKLIIICILVLCICMSIFSGLGAYYYTTVRSTETGEETGEYIGEDQNLRTTTTTTASPTTTVSPTTTTASPTPQGKYSTADLKTWFTEAGCTNMKFIDNYSPTGWWHSQTETGVKNDMQAWASIANANTNSVHYTYCKGTS